MDCSPPEMDRPYDKPPVDDNLGGITFNAMLRSNGHWLLLPAIHPYVPITLHTLTKSIWYKIVAVDWIQSSSEGAVRYVIYRREGKGGWVPFVSQWHDSSRFAGILPARLRCRAIGRSGPTRANMSTTIFRREVAAWSMLYR